MKRFKKFYIEITNVCNLKCDFCPVTKRKKQFITEEEFEQIVIQAKEYTDYIYFHVKGEPLLHPNIDKLLDIAHLHGLKVNITTNGTLLYEKKEMLLDKAALRQLNISLHSLSGNEGYSNPDSYMDNILRFVTEAKDKGNIIISYRLWNLKKDNELNKRDEKNRDILEKLEHYYSMKDRIEDIVQPGYGIKLGEKQYLNQDHVFTWPALDEKEDDGIGFCYGLRNQLAVLVDGTVVPCCLDGEGIIRIGNVLEESLTHILNSKRAQNIFEGFSNRYAVEELCRKCGYRQKFGK